MKILTLANQKGGVGKSAIADQLAFHCAQKRALRTLFIDLDHQANACKVLRKSGLFDVASFSGSELLANGAKVKDLPDSAAVLVPSDDRLAKVEKESASHNTFATNLKTFLTSAADSFDICIIDTNPNPDVRMMIALVLSTHVLSPIQLNQEALDGIASLIKDIKKIQGSLNPSLELVGLLPNLVENTPFQKDNLKQLIEGYSSFLIPVKKGFFANIPRRTAVAEAQAANCPIWTIPKTSAKEAWRLIEPVFNVILDRVGV